MLEHFFKKEVDPAFAKRAEFITKAIEQEGSKVILDAGCGRGFYVKLLSMLPTTESIVGIDINPEYIEKAKKTIHGVKNASVQLGSIYELPFKDNTFDAVVCSEIMEHLEDDAAALIEMKRVLKKGGIFVASVPHIRFPFLWDPLNWILMKVFNTHINKNIWWLAGIWADHERLYTKKELQEKVGKEFKVEEVKEVVRWCWPFTHFFLYAIGKNLVERFGASEFDRFNVEKKRPLSQFLAYLMRLPSMLLSKNLEDTSSVNLAIKGRKV